jgi:Cd(II)/Pb(II)-responsive transcriptional regulator
MRIGELAKASTVEVQTIRYYEREGLLPAPQRTAGNYRSYGPKHAERLAFIRRCRSLDMSLSEIRTLLEAIERPEADCSPVNALLDEHRRHVVERITELRQLKAELDAIRKHCKGSEPTKCCGILASLAGPARRREARARHVGGAHSKRLPR